MVTSEGREGVVMMMGYGRDFRADQVLFLDLGGDFKDVHLLIIHLSIHLFCLVFCICIFCYNKDLFQKGMKYTPLR